MDLSIVIPVYNTEKYLKECLDSVWKEIENVSNMEVILIDDGSTDASSKIYQSYQQPNFTYYRNENHGVSYSRNEGLKKATGKWVMFLDADDVLATGFSDILKEELKSKDDIIYFFHNYQNEELTKEKLLDNIIGLTHDYPYMTFPGARIFRRSFLEKNQILFHEDIINGEDLLFNLEALCKTKHYHIVGKNLYWYRYHLTSSTKKFHQKLFLSDQTFQQELKRIYPYALYEDFCLKNAIYTFLVRISYLKDKKEYQKHLWIMEESPYQEYLKKYQVDKGFSFVSWIVFLAHKKHYLLAILLIRGRRKVKRLFLFKKKQEYLDKV